MYGRIQFDILLQQGLDLGALQACINITRARTHLLIALGRWISVRVHAGKPWNVSRLAWERAALVSVLHLLDEAHRGLLEQARRVLVKAHQGAVALENERIQCHLDILPKRCVELFQRGFAEVLAARSFVPKPEGELRRCRGNRNEKQRHRRQEHRAPHDLNCIQQLPGSQKRLADKGLEDKNA